MAKKFVTNVLKKARRIDLRRVARGKYFRIVADVEVDGRDLKALLLERGLAVPYYGGKKARWMACCAPGIEEKNNRGN